MLVIKGTVARTKWDKVSSIEDEALAMAKLAELLVEDEGEVIDAH